MSQISNNGKRVERTAHLRWVAIPKMKVTVVAQREKINLSRVEHIANSFDPEQIGNPTVNLRNETYYVLDGMHRVEALKLIGWGDQQIQCWTYEGLSELEEAETFLKLNDTMAVSAFDKFRVGVNAGRPVECDIDRVVRAQGLRVSREKGDGAVGAVGTLRKVYSRAGAGTLARTLRIAADAYGDGGMDAPVIDGLGLLCQRYNSTLDDQQAITKLNNAGGVTRLLQKANKYRLDTGNARAHCVAAAAVDIINAGKGGKKIPSWWSAETTP